jgi:hypothetical protein
VWLDQDFYFKGVGQSYAAGLDSGASFYCKLDIDRSVRLAGEFNPQRITTGSSIHYLTGRKPVFVVAYVEAIGQDEITIRPIFIGHRLLVNGIIEHFFNDAAKVHPSMVVEFEDVDFGQRVSKADLNVLRDISEKQVKNAFAEIIGECDVPKDWGGEQFDLWTSRITVRSEHLQAAIMFKGPAAFKPMTIAELGKNGDQIDRLAQTAADILVVQHCHSIKAPVINMLRNYALNPRHPRRYMTIDGYDTVRILRHFGYLDLRQTP